MWRMNPEQVWWMGRRTESQAASCVSGDAVDVHRADSDRPPLRADADCAALALPDVTEGHTNMEAR